MKLPPMEIINVFKLAEHKVDEMFSKLGKVTCELMGDGSLRLGSLWESAWKQGGGNNIDTEMTKVPIELLQQFYDDKVDKTFLESFKIKNPKFALALKDPI